MGAAFLFVAVGIFISWRVGVRLRSLGEAREGIMKHLNDQQLNLVNLKRERMAFMDIDSVRASATQTIEFFDVTATGVCGKVARFRFAVALSRLTGRLLSVEVLNEAAEA